MTELQLRVPEWTQEAACTGLTTRDRDLWAPADHLDPEEKAFEWHLARRVCSNCPVRLTCAVDAIEALPRAEEYSMRGGLTPDELADVARAMDLRWRRTAQHGARSRYVAGCRCDDCRNAHRVYEHQRRLHRAKDAAAVPQTPLARVARRLSDQPRTARAISRATGLKTWRVRAVLSDLVAAGKVIEAGAPVGGAPAFIRRRAGTSETSAVSDVGALAPTRSTALVAPVERSVGS